MNQFLSYFIPIYFLLYGLFFLVIRSVAVSKKIGKSPIVIPTSDDAYGLIGNYLKAIVMLLSFYVFVFGAFPHCYNCFLPMEYLENDTLKIIGVILLILSFFIILVAQINMRNSFRIGIDTVKTDLVTTGLFRYSRNPIYVGMIGSLIGLFVVTPNAITLLILALGYVLIQIQTRLEEDYLLKNHGQSYLDYRKRVRRFL